MEDQFIQENLDQKVKEWIDNIKSITNFTYWIDLEEFNNLEQELCFNIKDEKNNNLIIYIPLDKINNPIIHFFENDNYINYNGDVSICDSILKLINKFKLL